MPMSRGQSQTEPFKEQIQVIWNYIWVVEVILDNLSSVAELSRGWICWDRFQVQIEKE